METAASPEARPYRSKRQRPCDVCRRRKHACRLEGPPPCTICRMLKTSCTFDQPPVKRRRRTTQVAALPGSTELMTQQAGESPHNQETISPISFSPLLTGWEGLGDLFPSHLQPSIGDSWLGAFEDASECNGSNGQARTAQQIQDTIPDSSAFIHGEMAADRLEIDKRRHCTGVTSSTQASTRPHERLRTSSGFPQDIDPHFPQEDKQTGETGIPSGDHEAKLREISEIIPLHMRTRLIALFLRYVFPALPVISRASLLLKSEMLVPSETALNEMAPCLLAGIYASSMPFVRNDPVLNVFEASQQPDTKRLWQIAHEGILQGMQRPNLSLIQALLLYLHRPDGENNWAMTGLAVSTATEMGLHLECQSSSVPAWEKRLRRRLWWVIYCEATWQSLLLGLPNPIHEEQFNVSDIRRDDFHLESLKCPSEETLNLGIDEQASCTFCHGGDDFYHLAGLSVLAYDVYSTFYTIASNAAEGVVDAAKPLLERLQQWQAGLPQHLLIKPPHHTLLYRRFHSSSGASIKLTFITLELMIYQGVLQRSDGTVSSPPAGWQPHPSTRSLQRSPNQDTTSSTGIEAEFFDMICNRTLECLDTAIEFVDRLRAYDKHSFWYSWSETCFCVVSTLLLRLHGNSKLLDISRDIRMRLDRWNEVLRDQSATFDQMRTGLLRIDSSILS